jgi:lipopolysaccharide export system protein LptC
MSSQQVTIDGPVRFTATGGYQLDTQDATIDLKTQRMRSGGDRATGTVPQGSFSASRLNADLESHVVKLDGNARLRIVPRKAK